MMSGERGPMGPAGPGGERGQHGDHGQTGDTGERGEKGERGINPWVVRQANLAYGILAFGLFLFVLVSQWQERQNDERDTKVLVRFEREAIATARSLCTLSVDSRTEINRNRDALRTLEAAVRQAFEMVQPAPDASPAARARTLEFRRQILAQLDAVEINGNLALPDCSVIGSGEGSSVRDAIRTTTSTAAGAPG